MQIKNNISTEAVMLEITHVAGDEHEVEIQDRSKNFSLFWFLATAGKVYGSRKENKVKTIICHWKQFPLNLWSRNQPIFTEKYLFGSSEKSKYVESFAFLGLPAVWYQDQNDEFQSHYLLQNSGQFQPGAEGKIFWLILQSGMVLNLMLHQM